jgi:hypothetical protein
MNDEKPIVKLVVFSQGGDRVLRTDGTCSGYGTPERPHAAAGEDIPDGTPAIDNRAAVETDTGFSWVFAGPMVDVNIPWGVVNKCPTPTPEMVAGMQGVFSTLTGLQLAARQERQAAGPLDMVSVEEYVNGWRDHGARIGRYQDGQIEWEG